MSLYYDLPWETRLSIMRAVEAAGSEHIGGNSIGGFQVAVGRGKFGDLIEAIKPFGFKVNGLVSFPLCSDQPPDHLRHDSPKYGGIKCNWLYADCLPA